MLVNLLEPLVFIPMDVCMRGGLGARVDFLTYGWCPIWSVGIGIYIPPNTLAAWLILFIWRLAFLRNLLFIDYCLVDDFYFVLLKDM